MSRLIDTIMSILVILFLLFFVFTGYSYLTYGGESKPTTTEQGKGLLSDAKDATSNAIGKVKDKTSNAAQQVKDGAKKATKKVKDSVPKISKSKDAVTTKKDNPKVSNPNSSSTNIKEARRVAQAKSKDIPESFEDKKPTRLNPKSKDGKDTAAEKLVAGKEKVTSLAKDAKDGVVAGASALKDKAGKTATNAKEKVADKADELKAKGKATKDELTEKGTSATGTSDDGKNYLVIAGSYSSKANANSELRRLQKLGVDAEVANFINSKYYTVCVGRYTTRKEAMVFVKELEKKHKIDAYLHKKR